MGFLSKLFGKEQNDKSKPENQKPAIADITFYEKVIDRIAVSDELKNDLKRALKQAFEDPKSFYDDNNEFILSDRGLKYPKDTLLTAKFVLIDTLQDNGQMAEVDWKEEESEIRIAVNEILKAKEYDFALSYDDLYEDKDTDEIIQLIDQKELKPNGYSLALLDINSDSYVFTIVPLNEKNEVAEMFAILK